MSAKLPMNRLGFGPAADDHFYRHPPSPTHPIHTLLSSMLSLPSGSWLFMWWLVSQSRCPNTSLQEADEAGLTMGGPKSVQ